MNVFVLDYDPVTAAKMYCDQHVTKMILESAQLLSTECHRLGVDRHDAYKPTHKNHPSAVWLRDNPTAATWLHHLVCELGEQHRLRFGTGHKSEWIGRTCAAKIWDHWRFNPHKKNFDTLDFPLCMPDVCKDPDPVVAYRQYYQFKANTWKIEGKAMRYTNVDPPEWLKL